MGTRVVRTCFMLVTALQGWGSLRSKSQRQRVNTRRLPSRHSRTELTGVVMAYKTYTTKPDKSPVWGEGVGVNPTSS